jgi:hypothetical protein
MSEGMKMLLVLIGISTAGVLFLIWMQLAQINYKLDEFRRLYRQDQDRREEGDEWKDA